MENTKFETHQISYLKIRATIQYIPANQNKLGLTTPINITIYDSRINSTLVLLEHFHLIIPII